MGEPEKTTRVIQTIEQPVEVELVKGARGQYRWSISVKADSALSALRIVQDIDAELHHRYGPAPEPEPGYSRPGSNPTVDPQARMDERRKRIHAIRMESAAEGEGRRGK